MTEPKLPSLHFHSPSIKAKGPGFEADSDNGLTPGLGAETERNMVEEAELESARRKEIKPFIVDGEITEQVSLRKPGLGALMSEIAEEERTPQKTLESTPAKKES